MFDHNTFPVLIALHFSLATPNPRTVVLCLTYNVYKILRSDLIALRFLVDTYGLGYIGLLSVHRRGVDTIAGSIIALYCC